jgi:hypothetical protein
MLETAVSSGVPAMRNYWFSKIASSDDALRVIKTSSTVFFVLAGIQVGAAAITVAFTFDRGTAYFPVPLEIVFNLLITAVIILILAFVLRLFNSRFAAISLLLLALVIGGTTLATVGTTLGPFGIKTNSSGPLFMATMAVLVAARATYATYKLQGGFAKTASNDHPSKFDPHVDFVSHPQSGLEATAATAASANRSVKPYDRAKWAALLKYDEEIARVADRIRPLGDRWVDELAHDYLVLNDKQYLRKIEDKIFADARAEAARSRL